MVTESLNPNTATAKSNIIEVKNLCKYYPLYKSKKDRVIEAIDPLRRKRHTLFAALDNISFNIAKGESIGIVGINGSGKSTLLKILSGVVTPSSGVAKVNGRVSALLELGAGFHPERTGLENVYFYGALQGLSKKEIATYVPSVIDFADIGDYIHQPVKFYSSGMFIRLAFAVAIQGNPDILIVDEALAVGDVCFQRKCFQQIEFLKEQNITFIFVSHSPEQIMSHCNRAILLYKGAIHEDGHPRTVTNEYLNMLFGINKSAEQNKSLPDKIIFNASEQEKIKELDSSLQRFIHNNDFTDKISSNPLYNKYEYRWGSNQAEIIDALFLSSGNIYNILPGDTINLHLKVLFKEKYHYPIFGFTLTSKEGITVFASNSEASNSVPYEIVESNSIALVTYSFTCNLAPGEYFISCGIAIRAGVDIPLDRRYDLFLLKVTGPAPFWGLSNLDMEITKTI